MGGDAKIIRAMPNTPSKICAGVTGIAATPNIRDDEKEAIIQLFVALGLVVWIDEHKMDALTALSGSGPAYFFYFMEVLAKAATNLGLSEEEADMMVRQTMLGAGALAANSVGTSLQTLREQVTSKAGVTQAALDIWMRAGTLDAQAKAALEAAVKRSKELAQ